MTLVSTVPLLMMTDSHMHVCSIVQCIRVGMRICSHLSLDVSRIAAGQQGSRAGGGPKEIIVGLHAYAKVGSTQLPLPAASKYGTSSKGESSARNGQTYDGASGRKVR